MYFEDLLSSGLSVTSASGEYAAKISIPGAVISGYNIVYQIYVM
jgi:hypothetical protein